MIHGPCGTLNMMSPGRDNGKCTKCFPKPCQTNTIANIYCVSPSITSQLVPFLWEAVEIGPLGHVRVVESLQNFIQKCDPVTLSGIRIHIAGVQQFDCR